MHSFGVCEYNSHDGKSGVMIPTAHTTSTNTSGGDTVEFADVTKSYGDKEVLHSFNLDIAAGEMISLLGPSGCGKSTALRCLSGFESITTGSIRIGGQDVIAVPPQRRGIGMVFQQYSLFPNLNVLQNVAFGLKIKGLNREDRYSKARDMLKLVGLEDYESAYSTKLSGGQQQRVALARAIVMDPQVLLLDEPLSALDAKIRVQLRDEIRALQQRLGITAIFVTHDQEEALAVSDRIAVMHNGNIEQIGTPKELYSSPTTAFVADFVGQSNGLESTILADGQSVELCGIRIPVIGHYAPHTLVRVYLRPENVMLRADENGDFSVVNTSFLGSIERTGVTGHGIEMVAQHNPSTQYRIGDRVAVDIRPDPMVAEEIKIPWVENTVADNPATATEQQAKKGDEQ
jgi:putative spermidine/putrescine transport system ATP-binding protein